MMNTGPVMKMNPVWFDPKYYYTEMVKHWKWYFIRLWVAFTCFPSSFRWCQMLTWWGAPAGINTASPRNWMMDQPWTPYSSYRRRRSTWSRYQLWSWMGSWSGGFSWPCSSPTLNTKDCQYKLKINTDQDTVLLTRASYNLSLKHWAARSLDYYLLWINMNKWKWIINGEQRDKQKDAFGLVHGFY